MAYLLDTNVLSELRKGVKASPKVRQWAAATVQARHFISVLSLGEIRKGIELLRKKTPLQCPIFEQWLGQLEADYDRDILPVTPEIADRWGRLMAVQTLPVTDGLIAATALVNDLTVVTRNTDDFKRSGVKLVNPF